MLINEFMEYITTHKIFSIINNPTNLKIVLFGNCHISTIGFYLNILLEKKYNIYMILGYNGGKICNDNEKNKIWNLINDSQYFIYMKHNNDFSLKANIIDTFAKNEIYLIPNIQLHFTNIYNTHTDTDEILIENFKKSYTQCHESIKNSDFQNFLFILDNYKEIRFFNTPTHPTHYILYLLAFDIYNKILNKDIKINLDYYKNRKNDDIFINSDTVILDSFFDYDEKECNILNINYNSEYYDINF